MTRLPAITPEPTVAHRASSSSSIPPVHGPPRARPSVRAVALVGLASLLVACGGGSSGEHATPTTATQAPRSPVDLSDVEWVDRTDEDEVVIQGRDNSFLPGYVVVEAGTPVTFRNVGRTEHNALPVDEISFEGVDADHFGPRAERTFTFDEPGDYPYYCSLHGTKSKGMVGAIRVVA